MTASAPRAVLRFALLTAALGAASGCDGAEAETDARDAADTPTADVTADVASDTAAGDTAAVDADAMPDTDDVSTWEPPPEMALTQYVDPFVGTEGLGHVIPGALVPHGVVRASPVTNSGTGDIDAYHHDDDEFFGIAHMHLEGAGGLRNGYGHVLVRPVRVALDEISAQPPAALDRSTEEAAPGYYAITADETRVEVTASRWGAVHRYTFEGDAPRALELNLEESRGTALRGEVTEVSDTDWRGLGYYQVHPLIGTLAGQPGTGELTVYWAMSTSVAPTGTGAWQGSREPEAMPFSGARVHAGMQFGDDVDVLTVRVGLSLRDTDNAAAHRDAQPVDFDDARAEAESTWNTRLNRVRAEGEEDDLRRFYTALYHTMFQPADYSEDGMFVSAWDGVATEYPLPEGRRYYTDDWCLWDTYRTSHPFRTIAEPEIIDDVVFSMLHAYRTGGWMPKCPWAAGGYSRVMTGNPQVAIVADAVVKGFDGFDMDDALAAVRRTSEEDSNSSPNGACGYFGLGTPPEYMSLGYVPRECDPTQNASITMEVAYADWALAQMAETLGETELAATYMARAESWRANWDSETGFPRGRLRDGSWMTPFDPTDTSDDNDFVEASAWIFKFFVPHDVPALIDIHGGEEAFIAQLDTFFSNGQYDPTNQPSFHIPFLYAHAGRPDLTQATTRRVMDEAYGLGRRGLPGNDDAGSTSAWFVLAAAGFYPVAPGGTSYTLSSPLLDRVEWVLNPEFQSDGTFVIEAVNNSPEAVYVESVSLNGVPLETPFIEHNDITAGGTLTFVMTDQAPE